MADAFPNPYQSPQSGVYAQYVAPPGEPAQPYKLYSLGGIVVATLVGGPLAGGVILAINYRRLARSGAALQAVIWSALATLAFISAAIVLPSETPNWPFWLVPMGGMNAAAKLFQGGMLDEHFKRGGAKASTLGAAGIGFLADIVVIVVFIAILMILPEEALGLSAE
jgi:hypothetical protein